MTLRRPDASPRAQIPIDATLRRRSSRLSRWLLELQTSTPPDLLDLTDVDPVGTRSNPYLAYPHLSMAALHRSLDDDADSMHDYVVVDEDIALECPPEDPLFDQVRNLGLLVDMSSDRTNIAITRLCADRYSYPPINNPTYQPSSIITTLSSLATFRLTLSEDHGLT